MQFNGKLVTILMLGVAIAAAGFAWWFQFDRGRRALAYWGGNRAALIRHGDEADVLLLKQPTADSGSEPLESMMIDQASYTIAQRVALNKAPGFVHARHALIDDASYQWEQRPPRAPSWTHALQFGNEQGATIVVLLDLDAGLLRPQHRAETLVMSETLHEGLKTFFGEQFGQE